MPKMLACSLALILPFAITACTQEPTATEPQDEAESPFRPVASIQEIMQAIVAPSADVIWNAVGFTSTASGVEQRQPETDEDWQMLRYHTLELIEAANLLVMEGRQVAAPGATLQYEGLEGNLTAAQIQTALETQRPEFVAFAHALHDAAMESLAAIEARNADRLSNSGGTIDEACEACHTTFWYPAAQ